MSEAVKNPAREAELQRLIAEQAADDKDHVSHGYRSLDAPLYSDSETSLHEVLEERSVEVGPAPSRAKHSYKVTSEQVKEWRGLRDREHWTHAQIAEYAGVRDVTVRRHLSDGKRMDRRTAALAEHLSEAREAYEAGAFLREIAELLYDECGYASWQACYQGLRRLFQREGVSIRPVKVSRRGRPKPGAPLEEWQRFWRRHNRRMRDQRRKARVRCDAVLRSGRPCRQWALYGGRYCVSHDERTRRPAKWTRGKILEALRQWANANGRNPKSADWYLATAEHPNSRTVGNMFGRWHFALYEAGLSTRKHPAPPSRRALIARGYHECARPGCTKLVAASRHFCRDRRCQDARFTLVVEPRHGTMVGYKVDGCRCGPCTEANTEHQREYRRSRQVAA